MEDNLEFLVMFSDNLLGFKTGSKRKTGVHMFPVDEKTKSLPHCTMVKAHHWNSAKLIIRRETPLCKLNQFIHLQVHRIT